MLESFAEQVAAFSAIEWIGVVSGLIAVWCSIKEKLIAWPIYIICYACYTFLSWEIRLYPFLGLNLIFIGLSIYGWRQWAKVDQDAEAAQSIQHSPRAAWGWVAAFCLISTLSFGTLFSFYDAYVPYLDALAASIALSAQWMLGRRYLETWLLWIISDILYIGIWAGQAYWPTVGLFGIFVLLAIKGWIDWKRQAHTPNFQEA